MDKALIEKLVAQVEDDSQDSGEPLEYVCRRQLQHFAQLVAEECAKIADDNEPQSGIAGEIREKFGLLKNLSNC
jgi:hypothetical protein